MRWHREAYLALMTFDPPPRPMFVEPFGPLIGLQEEWIAQGATPAELDMTAFDWDYVERAYPGGNTSFLDRTPPVTLEETETFIIQRDDLGRTMRMDKRTATIPLPLDYPVKNMDDWLKIKPRLVYREDRVNAGAAAHAKAARQQGKLIVAGMHGGFDLPRQLMGEENACMAYYDQPELMHDILQTLGDMTQRVLEEITALVQVDQLSVHEDFAGKSGPLMGPAQIREFLNPYYQRCWRVIKNQGGKIFQQDSDGNLNAILEAMSESGLTSLLPNEPAAGMDIVAIREKFGQTYTFVGGIDKFCLQHGPEAIRKELEYKLQPKLRNAGGVVFGLDHRIPNGTPLQAYRDYVKLGREILGLPPLDPSQTGWQRMAF